MISKIEKCREAIVPVTCGGQTGTAFFIESNRLLTAWHVVSDYFLCRTKIVIVVNGQPIECEAEGCKEKDLAILSCNLVEEVTPIGLLCARFREGAEYTILGFPNELGNGIDDLAIVVRTQSKKSDSLSDFDVVVKRIKGAEVISYCGFSGSPVLNDFGFAVGVVTDQLYGTLGYRSLISVVEWLKTNGIVSIIEREAEYDMRKIGLGRSIQFLNESLLRVGNRYNKRLHVQNQNFEKKLDYFAEIGKDEDLKVIISSYQKFYEELQLDQKQKLANFTSLAHFLESGDVIDNFWQDVESINIDIIGEDAERHYTYYQRQYWSEFFANIESILSRNSYCDARFLRINGKAGTGKTHQLCQWAYSASKKCRVYLFFSTQFLERRTPWETMLELLGWEEEDFDKLDQELGAEKEQAVFIIDALNEGAGTYYWQNNLQNLVEHIKRYLHVKLIVSVRNFEKNDVMSRAFGQEWDNVTINGFEDPKKAVSMYFNDYGISEDVDRYLKIPDFRTPLFLKIYCEAYRSFTKEERRGMNRLIMYERYLKTRNDEVSKKIDEDPKRNVTSKYLHSIGELSLYRYLGMNVPRDNAISIGRRLCPLRLWSKDLYHNLVAENLLKEYPVAEDCYVTDFEYDSLGDYIRASQVLRKYSDDSSAHDAILRIKSLITDERVCLAGKDRLRHVLVAFFSVWNPKKEIWMKCVSDSYLAPYVMEAWMCRSHDEKNDTFTDDVIRDVVSRYSNFTSAEFVITLNCLRKFTEDF
ncbi:MAG: trypsin-like peptidase domain-containing protein [Paludibacteraceae bacterium]|nr:trypsin-like peptidase domain-containing protein [Paludibacteraceae bacterium]